MPARMGMTWCQAGQNHLLSLTSQMRTVMTHPDEGRDCEKGEEEQVQSQGGDMDTWDLQVGVVMLSDITWVLKGTLPQPAPF